MSDATDATNSANFQILKARILAAVPSAKLDGQNYGYLQGYAKAMRVPVPKAFKDYTMPELAALREGDRKTYDRIMAERFGVGQ